MFCALLVGIDTDDEVNVREAQFGLSELECVSKSSRKKRGKKGAGGMDYQFSEFLNVPSGRGRGGGRTADGETHPKWNKSYTPSAYILTGLSVGGSFALKFLITPSSAPFPSTALLTKPLIFSSLNHLGGVIIFGGPTCGAAGKGALVGGLTVSVAIAFSVDGSFVAAERTKVGCFPPAVS